ncbi:MAG: asparagine synthase (glutamine-hydrolyzing) [bacterium]
MCGIAGVLGEQSPDNHSSVSSMLRAMTHRGPDQDGLWSTHKHDREVVFGHRRLSIIDLSEAGRQPMVDSITGASLTFNGECYNFKQLRQELAARGYQFVSSSDTEVMLAAYSEWGEAATAKFRGMFALAYWNPKLEAVSIVRDRLGVKPLYYQKLDSRFTFASELRALLLVSNEPRKLDPVSLNSYLWHGFVPGPRTLVRGIRLLEAGKTLTVGLDGYCETSKQYWQIPVSFPALDQQVAKRNAVRELEEAVQLRLVSDVPLGVFLSGGVDSSVLAALAQRSSDHAVRTFNIKFDEKGYDESSYAQTVADALGTDHSEIKIDEIAFNEGLESSLNSLDQPTFDGINTYFVSKAVRDAGLTVALSGAGGDELFGGYASFVDIPRAKKISTISNLLPIGVSNLAARLGARVLAGSGSEIKPQTRFGKLQDVVATRGRLLDLYQVSYSLFTREFLMELLLANEENLTWGLEPERHFSLMNRIQGENELVAITHLELSSFIGERLLRDTDSASMAASLEVRVPLLDHVFIEKLAALEPECRYKPARQKSFLKSIVVDELPAKIFDRPKAGFEIPLELWCKRSLQGEIEKTFSDLSAINSIGLNCETVSRLWRAFKKGGKGTYWSRVWSIYVLARWCKHHHVCL